MPLHKGAKIIAPKTLLLIKQLQSLPFLKGFHLVGGTALAFQLGHRNSIDLDLFSQSDFNTGDLIGMLSAHFKVQVDLERTNTLLSYLNNIKVDFIKHDYPYVNPPVTEEGITFLSKEDIAAMKLNTIIQSGKRLKDFIDVYYLLEHFSVNDLLEFFTKKYAHANPLMALKALNYFGDLDESFDPPKLLKPDSISQIKKRIQDATLHSKKVFRDKNQEK